MKFEFSRIIFYNYSSIKFHENPSCSSRLFHEDGMTHTLDNNSQFRNFASGLKMHENIFMTNLCRRQQ